MDFSWELAGEVAPLAASSGIFPQIIPMHRSLFQEARVGSQAGHSLLFFGGCFGVGGALIQDWREGARLVFHAYHLLLRQIILSRLKHLIDFLVTRLLNWIFVLTL